MTLGRIAYGAAVVALYALMIVEIAIIGCYTKF